MHRDLPHFALSLALSLGLALVSSGPAAGQTLSDFELPFNHRNSRPGGGGYNHSVDDLAWERARNDPITFNCLPDKLLD
jgi:hypothetical protein